VLCPRISCGAAIRGRSSGVTGIARPEPDYDRLVGALIDAAQREIAE
jgi:hypothetical protein